MQQWRNLRTIRAAAAILILAQLSWAGAVSAQGTVEDIASGLICLCGCGKLLNVCDMETAKQMKDIIGDKLAQGWGKKQIVEYMTATYGEKVLAAPTKKGFNLTAWITPFALIFVGVGVIAIVVQTWVRHRRTTSEEEIETAVSEELESKYGETLERELKEFEE
jgi:cytochrome c-type biogenesis protein CcmH